MKKVVYRETLICVKKLYSGIRYTVYWYTPKQCINFISTIKAVLPYLRMWPAILVLDWSYNRGGDCTVITSPTGTDAHESVGSIAGITSPQSTSMLKIYWGYVEDILRVPSCWPCLDFQRYPALAVLNAAVAAVRGAGTTTHCRAGGSSQERHLLPHRGGTTNIIYIYMHITCK